VDERHGQYVVRALVVGPAGDQIVDGRPAAAIGNVGDVHLDGRIEQRTGQMVSGPDPGRAVLHFRLVCFGIGDELLQILDRQILARDQYDRLLADQRDGREIGHGVVERMLVERLAMREGPGAAEYELITVGRGLRHAACARHAAGAADVFYDHLLAEDL